MRLPLIALVALGCSGSAGAEPAVGSSPATGLAATTVDHFFVEALAHGQAHDNLRELTTRYPGRLAGTKALEGAVAWGQRMLADVGADRVYTQEVTVPHWDRGAPGSVRLLAAGGPEPLAAAALGNSTATPTGGLTAEVVQVMSIHAVEQLGRAGIEGRIVFFNRPMNPKFAVTGDAYADACDQRTRGPGVAAKFGAVAALTRSLTFAHDDWPHTGNTSYLPGFPKIPAAALSTVAADRLAAALVADPHVRVSLESHAQALPNAPSHNVVGEIRGSEFPDQIIVVGGHLDSWDIAPGAHDDGAGVVQAIEVFRLFRALGLRPRHTLRCVLFTNEENGLAGATRYAQLARDASERHIFAVESDNGGFAPNGFNLGSTQGSTQGGAHVRAARWRPLFEPWGLWHFTKGAGAADVNPLLLQGATVAGLAPDSQRYFDYHHTAIDTIDQVNPRELHLGAGALAALIWLVDTQGL